LGGFITIESCFYGFKQGLGILVLIKIVTTPGIVEVDAPSAFVVVRATGLKEFPSSMISQRA
ncbi:hypothetical protein Tco_0504424, partial [Tanacetum coccineum]